MKKRKFVCVLAIFAILVSLTTGCSLDVDLGEYDTGTQLSSISSQTVAENDNYSLRWDDDGKCVMFECTKTGKVWSNIPYEYYLKGGTSANLNSTLNITVANTTTLQWDEFRGYTETIENGRVLCEKIKQGLRITYFFDRCKISIPVNYELREDSVLVTIDTPGIKEKGSEYLLVSISLAPFLTSVRNETPDAYLFLPSGTGALMYATENADKTRKFSSEVYGTDASRQIPEVLVNEEPIRLPVFGAKDGESALLGILENGAGAAFIEAESGNKRTGYSSVYPTFYVRGYDIFAQSSYGMDENDVTRVSEEKMNNTVSVGYYPLSGENADYNGMAKRYKQYLQDKEELVISDVERSPYSTTLLGGILTTSSVLGIPQKTLKTMTTFSQANQIVSELYKKMGVKPVVRLIGFEDNGINPGGEVAGGFGFPAVFGSKNDRNNLEKFCKQQKMSLFYDFDLIRYSKSGGGFSYSSDTAKTASLHKAEQYHIQKPLRDFDKSMSYQLLKRRKLLEAADKLFKAAKNMNLAGVSLSTLGSMCYSDYSDSRYAAKGNIDYDVNEIIKKAQASGSQVAVAEANAYAAGIADVVFDVPMENGDYNVLDAQIPFYQMVFGDCKPLYSPAVNLVADPQKQIMLAATSGIGLGFTLIENFDISFMETDEGKLYGARYADVITQISESLKAYVDYYTSVAGVSIESYEILPDNVSKTEFANGVTVYANHNTFEWRVEENDK